MDSSLATFWSLVERIGACMMTTRDAMALRARPMNGRIDRSTGEFRFLTRRSSHKTDELAAHPEVNLAFCDAEAGDFVSVSGQAYLTQDATLIDKLWSASAQRFLDAGKDDPDIAVIRVVPSIAEHWGSDSNLRQVWSVFRARVGDIEPHVAESRKRARG